MQQPHGHPCALWPPLTSLHVLHMQVALSPRTSPRCADSCLHLCIAERLSNMHVACSQEQFAHSCLTWVQWTHSTTNGNHEVCAMRAILLADCCCRQSCPQLHDVVTLIFHCISAARMEISLTWCPVRAARAKRGQQPGYQASAVQRPVPAAIRCVRI
jgi:hypothetical protein